MRHANTEVHATAATDEKARDTTTAGTYPLKYSFTRTSTSLLQAHRNVTGG